jgi:hypothetical protein
MGRLIKHISILILLTLAMYSVFMLVTCKVDYKGKKLIYSIASYIPRKGGQEASMLKELDKTTEFDIVVLGSSHAYRGYDPRVFEAKGINLFNAGSSAQTFETSLHIAKNHINFSGEEVVILDIYPLMFEIEGIETVQRLIVDETDGDAAFDLVTQSKDFRSINSFVKRKICEKDTNDWVLKGYVVKGYCTNPDTLDIMPPSDTLEFKPLDKNIEDFVELYNYAKREAKSVVLVSHPMPNDLRKIGMEEFMEKHTMESSTYFVDYTTHARFNLQDFSDPFHLNQAGVEKFNELLIENLPHQ